MEKQESHERIQAMEWDTLEDSLLPSSRGAKAATSEQSLRDYFGDEEYEKLKQLARQSRAVRTKRALGKVPPLGNIILIPGVMGSNLARLENGDRDTIWIHYLRIIAGQISTLKLAGDGKSPTVSGLKIVPTEIDKRTYARAVIKLRGRWNVEPFAYDWRKDLDAASDSLLSFINEKFGNQPVNLVAHSMGGLVSRNFIRRHKKRWESMRGDDKQGGRLVMLGTPNFGSFNIPQVLTGVESLVVLLSRADLGHDLRGVLEIINTFLGCYLMLPAPSKIPMSMQGIYDRDTWGDWPISSDHLDRARQFHQGLEDPDTIDPARMTYVAGCNRRTVSGLEVVSPGEFRYTETLEGDGRVTHKLGLLEGIRTYYVNEVHGDLTRNDVVLQAVEDILQRGVTAALSEKPIAPRAVVTTEGRWSRSIGEYAVATQVEEFARRVKRGDPVTPDETRVAEDTIMRAALGRDPAIGELATLSRAHQKSQKKDRPKLEVEVLHDDVRRVVSPVVVAGHYKGSKPINALGAIDQALDGWISQATAHSMIGGDLGRLFFTPVNRGQIRAGAVLLAGMGEEGKFGEDDLRYMMLNVTYAISALKEKHFATLLVGAGNGGLQVEQSVRGLLSGVCDALHRLPRGERVDKVSIVEFDHERCVEIHELLEKIQERDLTTVDITLAKSKPKLNAGLRPGPKEFRRKGDVRSRFQPRITIERDQDVFRFSALTEAAVIPVREVEIQSFYPDSISQQLMDSTYTAEQERLGRLLTTTLIPEDFMEVLNQPGPLTLVLDRSTAAIPWEMAAIVKPAGTKFLGPDLRLTRQFRTFLSPPPGITPAANDKLRILVIADPAPEPEYQLAGARLEGREVVKLLSRIKNKYELNIEVIDRIGDGECDPVGLLSLILDGNFDIIHYAGHGEFNVQEPKRGGWVFGKDRILTSREIFRARRVPRLIFANACYSAVVNPGKPLTAAEMNRGLAGIAEAFLERGVQNYIGSGWPVADDQAVQFALTFYSYALTGGPVDDGDTTKGRGGAKRSGDPEVKQVAAPKPLAEALGRAREAISREGSTWGAYHHYGQTSEVLINVEAGVETTERATMKARRRSTKKPKKAASKKSRKK
jgi:pimeloyl-ACP methyl ester carboxylesterase